MRAFDSRQKHTAEQEFAGVRQWYHSLPLDARQRLKQDMQSLAQISQRMQDWEMFVKVHWSCEQSDEKGNVTSSVGTTQAPNVWLEAIDQWDETGPESGGSEP